MLINFTAHDYILLCSFIYSPCLQYILRNKRLTFWETSFALKFSSLARNDENPIFDLENGGSTYTRVNTISAAVVAARLDRMLRQEIDMQVGESVFWSDSSCVLAYIGNDSRRFHTFVANRVAAIQEASSPSQWRHASSEQNPANDASGGLSADALTNKSRWLRGPDFLWQPVHTWPIRPCPVPEGAHGDPEVKKTTEVFFTSTEVRERSMNSIFQYFSLWFRLKKFFAWMLRFRVKLRNAVEQRRTGRTILSENSKIDPITHDELESAEREIIRHVQNESFEKEVATLKRSGSSVPIGEGVRKRNIKKSSKVIKLDPRLLDGVMRVGGRLGNGSFQPESMHPMILPKSRHVVTIIRHYHQVSGHSGAEYVLSLIRERFWIISARAAVRKSLRACVGCKKRQARVGEQKMANLP